MAQLPRPDKDERSEPQCDGRHPVPVEPVDGAQQRADGIGFENGGAVIDFGCRQRTAQIVRWITFGPRRADGVPKDQAAGAAQPPCRLIAAARLDGGAARAGFRGP